ncbi:multidrug ABC transporter permease [Corynebacterium felinum]|uniref:ABC-2 type transport system permease protein n=1 Tax=Corynebacterium felinum TaxID=131318 RepID=A0ABU2B5K8_9CORY|nr:multidrug ABC transporter permease [Corynebacterium felinum]MDF5820143.1 multidrug ABC transporter permease [Corynebacterium felinum]MDR7353895.1 ABC-2 type transport system permease protein [Corynebacterium felinum]WJY96068.1 ABC-2 family transporter protein [Corynebacterium felinum]
MLNTIRSEWTKLSSTKALYWTTGVFVALCWLYAGIVGYNVEPDPTALGIPILYPAQVLAAVSSLGLIVVAIQAIMVFTAEYRHNYASVTFLATPNRVQVTVAKWVLYSVFTAVLTFVTTIGALYVAKMLASDVASSTLRVFEDDNVRRYLWMLPLANVLAVTFSQGVAMLLRQTAGAVALMSVWIVALENLLGLIPKVGEYVVKYGPFSNLFAFSARKSIVDIPWGHVGSGVYFMIWAAVLLIAGMWMIKVRDA